MFSFVHTYVVKIEAAKVVFLTALPRLFRIIPNEVGTLVTMKFRVRSKPKAEMQWYKGNQKIRENEKFKSKYIELGNDEYEVLLEILVSSNFSF